MEDLKGKKLLILGANPETVPLVQKANDMGIYTIVADYNPNAYAKRYAREGCNIDGMDVESLVRFGRENKVDGVLVGVADRLIVPYQKVCEGLGLPCYGTEEQCRILTDKALFNQECEKYGISGIPSYHLDRELKREDLDKLVYPVLVKPADSNSGKGMTVCYSEKDVVAAVGKALECSKSKRFLAERYMTCDDIYIFYTFIDGFCWPSIIADRFTCRGQKDSNPVCLGAKSPSSYTNLYYDTLHEKMCKMFSAMGLKNGVLMVSAFVEGEKIYLYDPGFRLQGEAPNLTVKAMTGCDQIEMLIRFALTGTMGTVEKTVMADCRTWDRHAATIWYLLHEGTIRSIQGLEELKDDPAVFQVVRRFQEGMTVGKDMVGTEAQVLARVYLACSTPKELREKVCALQRSVRVLDEQGRNMLLEGFSVEKISG